MMILQQQLADLAERIRSGYGPYVGYDEVQQWPKERLEELIKMGVLAKGMTAKRIACTDCVQGECSGIEPTIETNEETGETAGFFLCNQGGGLKKVTKEQLQQWVIVVEKLPKEEVTRKDNDKPRISRQQKNVHDKTLLISTLLLHHKFDSTGNEQDEINYQPATQETIRKQLNWSQSKVSRVLKKSFGEAFWKRYNLACKSDALKGFLKNMDDNQVDVEAIA